MWWSFAFPNNLVKLIIISLISETSLPSFAAEPRICAGELAKEMQPLLSQPQFSHASVSVVVAESENSSQTFLFNFQSDRSIIPASTLKLFTTVAALKILKPDYQFSTRILAGEDLENGILNHDLMIEGSGDPSFSSASLKNLVGQLRSQGIKQVKGRVVFSDRLNAKMPSGWEWNDLQEDYAASPHGFTINGNLLNWRIYPAIEARKPLKFVWEKPELALSWKVENQAITQASSAESSLQVERDLTAEKLKITGALNIKAASELGATAVPNPLTNFSRLLLAELTNQGIRINSQTITNSQPKIKIYAQVLSAKLKELIRTMNKESNNLFAELLYQTVIQRIKPGELQKLWQSLGIESDRLRIYDGSGLSRHNSILPEDLVKLLQAMVKDQNFRDSLAIASVDGTLKNRLKDTRIWAKTGSMQGISVLAGYLQPSEYPELALVIAINHGSLINRENRNLIDEIALTLNRLRKC